MLAAWLKRKLPAGARRRARRLGRFRWFTKARLVRGYGHSRLRWLSYVLLDPEVDSFTYSIGNQHELAQTLAHVLTRPSAEVAELLAETRGDGILRQSLRQPIRHLAWAKRMPEPKAYHQACWAIVRATRPSCVVETGVLDGMASTVILAALARNSLDGATGELLSFDTMPGAGAMVPAGLRHNWVLVHGDATELLDQVIEDRQIGLFACDSSPPAQQINAELEAVLRHRGEEIVAMTAWGWLADELDWPTSGLEIYDEQPVGHFYTGDTLAIASL
jgi:Methyltransferase domain